MRIILTVIIQIVILVLLVIFNKIFKKSNLIENVYNSMYLLSKYILGCNLEIIGNPLELNDKLLVISNHPTTLDFMYLLHWAKQHNRIKDIRFIAKDGIGNIPGVGKYIRETQCLISRDYEADKDKIIDFCKRLSEEENYILVIFPEGTTVFPESKAKSQTFSEKNDKPVFENVLYPRHKGLELILKNLVIEQVLDITLFYDDDKKCYKCAYDKDFLFDSYPKHGKILEKDIELEQIKIENIEKLLEKTWRRKEKFIRKILEKED